MSHDDQLATKQTEAPSGRRRFLGVGAGATPALLMLASQPALGVTCFTPSRALSKNTSISQQGKYGDCTGAGPASYVNTYTSPATATTQWPGAPGPDLGFHPLFAGSFFNLAKTDGSTVRSLTLLEVLNLPTKPNDIQALPSDTQKIEVAKYLVTAYLNIQKNWVPANVLTSSNALVIWSEFNTKGYFEPMASVKWYAPDILSYLKTSGIAPA